MIRGCGPQDTDRIYEIVNDAARAYAGVIPEDCYHQPYMPMEELRSEMGLMSFFGWEDGGQLMGVMGFQPVKDVTLIRHAYVLTEKQGHGVGSRLLGYLRDITATRRLLVGTWADAAWAIRFYEKHGFGLMPDKDELLRRYWTVPDRQIAASVVLGIELEWSKP